MSAALVAYIDPGTAQNVFTGLAPYLAALGTLLVALLWPFRYVWSLARAAYARSSVVGRAATWLLIAALAGSVLAGGYLLLARGPRSATASTRNAPGAAATSLAPRVTSTGPKNAMYQRVIVLGMDGLDAGLTEELMAAGQLPNFARLREAGGYARLATSNPAESPVAWSSIATGTDPAQHGIFDFLYRSTQSYLPALSLRKSTGGWLGTKYTRARQRDGFWVHTSAAGVPTTVVRWPVAFPAEKVTGRFLAGFGVPDLTGGEGRYTYFTSAPIADDDPSKANVAPCTWDGQHTALELHGPLAGRNKETLVALDVSKTGDDRLQIRLPSGTAVEVALGQWSGWLPVEFSVGLGSKVRGQVKFFLTELSPALRLVTSPIHMDPVQQAFPLTQPPEYGRELREQLGPFHTLGMPEQVHPLSHGRYDYAAFLAECQAVTRERRAMLSLELERFDRGVLAFVFDTTDRLQHAFWATRDAQHPAYRAADAEKFGDVIPAAYREMDEVLGQVLARCDERTLLLVLSDHGFNAFRRAVHVNRWLVDQGLMKLKVPDGKPGETLFKDVDWSRTTAYACGFCSLYLNVFGREEQGIVDSVAGYPQGCDEIAARLKRWIDPESGQPVFKNVYRADALYPMGDNNVPTRPDLILGFNSGYRASWQTALGGAPLGTIEDNTSRWSGDHLIDPELVPGVLFSNRRLGKQQPQLIDICPSVLEALAVPVPAYVQGTSVFGND
ncbi:MAG: alkaline phosphatase family protein [Pirellulales bacterium]|nr:alkaline phosphatase family protein [Pirellulales bacterium]